MLQNQKVLVAGLGGTGISVLAYCAHIGAEAAGYDAQLSETQRTELTEKFRSFRCLQAACTQRCKIMTY